MSCDTCKPKPPDPVNLRWAVALKDLNLPSDQETEQVWRMLFIMGAVTSAKMPNKYEITPF